MYINTVANSVMLQEYLGHDFHNRIFKIKCKLHVASGSAPPPLPVKGSGCTPSGKNAFVIYIKHCVVKGWSFCVYEGEIVLKL